ncbi:uncharacterized protein [Macrobrachium rosenbergii]|uniref:uncharacterized protein n=1 Tax=Macrobrachium rosenbergii TaxID=79674 RepID=UPI0034D5E99D
MSCDTEEFACAAVVVAQMYDQMHNCDTKRRKWTNNWLLQQTNKGSYGSIFNELSEQTSKVGRHTESGVGDFPQPGRHFGHIHVDLVGPLPPSGGARHLLTVVDHSTRWPGATPMEEATASACAEALLSSWISWFGVPDHQKKVYGESLVVPGELITGDCHNLTVQRLRDTVGKFAPCQRTNTDRTTPFTPPSLSSTTHVFVRNDTVSPPLTRPYRGPFLMLKRNKKAFQLAIHGKNDWVSIDRLKPTLLEGDVGDTPQRSPQEMSPRSPPRPQESRMAAP